MRYLSIAFVALIGCKGGGGSGDVPPPKMDSAKSTAESLVVALKAKSLPAVQALLPGPDQLGKVLDCDVAALATKLKAEAEKELKDVPEGNTVELGAFDKFGSEEKAFKVGDEWQGCKVKAAWSLHKSKVELHFLHESKTDFKDVVMRFAQFPGDDKWYYLR